MTVEDTLSLVLWTSFLFSGVGATLYLHKVFGVLVVSQATVMSLAALVDVATIRSGASPILGTLGACIVGLLLGGLHVPLLIRLGGPLLLIVTVVLHMLLTQLWYALPWLTGGSGGLLLTGNSSIYSSLLAFVLATSTSLWMTGQTSNLSVDNALLRRLGPNAGVFGRPAEQRYWKGFVSYGLVLGAAATTAVRMSGYLAVDSFSLSWSLAVLMIALAVGENWWPKALGLSLGYAALRVILRQSIAASSTVSHIFELGFPLLLLTMIIYSNRGDLREGSRENEQPLF